MTASSPPPRASAATWAARVRAWQQSGQTAVDFATRHHLDPRQLRWWKWSLRRRSSPLEAPVFLPVRLVSPASPAAVAIEIVLRNGRTVRVPQRVDPALLASVLAAAERV